MTPLLALTGTEQTMWTIVLALGVVVLAVVVVLLTWLYRTVERIDVGVRAVWESATRVAGNTATTWQLTETVRALEELADEFRRHGELLEGHR